MNFIRQIERLQKLNKLIEQEKTGTPEELASRLGISKRQLHNLIETLKDMGAGIVYSKKNGTYQYEEKYLTIDFSLRLVTKEECRKIYGGSIFFTQGNSLLEGGPTFRGCVRHGGGKGHKNIPKCNFISL